MRIQTKFNIGDKVKYRTRKHMSTQCTICKGKKPQEESYICRRCHGAGREYRMRNVTYTGILEGIKVKIIQYVGMEERDIETYYNFDGEWIEESEIITKKEA